ncbi:hypothetical protein LCGC14_0584960 [marine sediment metagenome]|uniref:NADPH-dependent FMN reductase-like domain-containing protein n=1 Tax=marine sediment metagenome TaxID=412755 RepID=A0A0F9RZ26_9ZZZZ|nr:NADPH-dependent oxidoreductase [Methylophaga sp.]HEC60049.1 NADPH-dependent oxidoreductase [Methylophaga sp.]
MNVLAFGASSSKHSINKMLARYTAGLIDGATVDVVDLNDYELPLFSVDKEAELGQPELAKAFLEKIAGSDLVVISFAEHNGSYSAAFKNLFDWCSRINNKVYQGKPLFLLATSPGPGGAQNVLSLAENASPHFDGHVKAAISVPSFYDNFDVESGKIMNHEINEKLIACTKSIIE